jgi:L-rhamnose mutarotase
VAAVLMLAAGNNLGENAKQTTADSAASAAQTTKLSRKENPMQRYGSVIGLNPDKIDEYKKLHAAVWPDVLKMITQCNIRNYSIYLRKIEGRYYLFSYFEYTGGDFAGDMAKMAADPTTQRWWECCKPCQAPLADRAEGEWWANMEEVFHLD